MRDGAELHVQDRGGEDVEAVKDVRACEEYVDSTVSLKILQRIDLRKRKERGDAQ